MSEQLPLPRGKSSTARSVRDDRFFVVMLDARFDPDNTDIEKVRANMKAEWEKIWDGKPPMPLLVLPPGVCEFAVVGGAG